MFFSRLRWSLALSVTTAVIFTPYFRSGGNVLTGWIYFLPLSLAIARRDRVVRLTVGIVGTVFLLLVINKNGIAGFEGDFPNKYWVDLICTWVCLLFAEQLRAIDPHQQYSFGDNNRHIFIGLALGMLLWILDGIFDAIVLFSHISFDNINVTDSHEAFMRGMLQGGPMVFGVGGQALEDRFRAAALLAADRDARTRAIVTSSPDAILTIDAGGIITSCNAATSALFGYAPEELLGENVSVLMPSPHREAHNGYIQQYLKTGNSRIIGTARKLTGLRKNGSAFPLELSVAKLDLPWGTGFSGIIRDITHQEQSAAEIGQLKGHLEQVIAVSPAVIYTCATSENFPWTFVSPNIKKQFGYAQEECLSRPDWWSGNIHPDDKERIFAGLAGILEKDTHTHEYRFRAKDGLYRWVRDQLRIVRDASGKPAEMVGAWLDITDRKLSEAAIERINVELEAKVARRTQELRLAYEQIQQTEKMQMIGRLASGIAHDFNNLLAGVRAHTELLRKSAVFSPQDQRSIDQILVATDSGAALIGQLLTFARNEPAQDQSVSLDACIGSAVENLPPTKNQSVKINTDGLQGGFHIRADAARLESVFLNLLMNALDAVPESGGEVRIFTHLHDSDGITPVTGKHLLPMGRYVEVCVQDNGHGMDQKTVENLFEPFFTTKHPGRGTGLGLFNVYSYISSIRGTVSVRSKPGEGSTFCVFLPLFEQGTEAPCAGAPAQNAPETAQSAPSEQGTRILLADDEAFLAAAMGMHFEHHGYQVTVCDDGKSAVEAFKKEPAAFDLVLMDFVMPGMNGHEAYLAMRKIRPDIPCIIMSGNADPDRIRLLLKDGVRAVLQKPFPFSKVLSKIREILA